MARREEIDEGRERSKKRRVEEEQDHPRREEEDDGKRRERHKHNKHRKHKHRSHRRHKEESRPPPPPMAVEEPPGEMVHQQSVEETEDGEILEHMDVVVAVSPKNDGVDGNVSSDHHSKSASPKRSRTPDGKTRSRSREVDEKLKPSFSPERRHRSRSRGHSLERRRRSRSRDHGPRYHARGGTPERNRRRSRSRDRSERNDFRSRRYYSPARRRRSVSKDFEERDGYTRRRGDSRDRSYRDERGREIDRSQKEKMAVDKHERAEAPKLDVKNAESVNVEDDEKYLERVANQLAEQEEDVEKVKEESRRRRQAIMEKYKMQQETTVKEPEIPVQSSVPVAKEPELPVQSSVPVAKEPDSGEGIIDPSTPLTLGKQPVDTGDASPKKATGGLGEGSPPKSEMPADMFCDDIFGESPAEVRKVPKGDTMAVDTSGLTDNWDDHEGYYTYRVGEVLDNRYEIASSHGRGVFSTVVRARDTKPSRGDPEEVAIKIIRSNETMYKAGQMELVILKKLAGADLENRRHCVRLLSSFEYRHHLCLVFESLHMNLREILKKFGRNIGISLGAVRSYAKQLFIALKHLRNCGVLHCDIKPDNMLVNESKNLLKLCDFGSAMFAGENEITPYLVSRFYRAPEIILGLPYDHALDMWSVGCCLYELYTGKVLFPGPTNNDMLRLHMELKGAFPKKMLRKAQFAAQHFDQDFNFLAFEEDPVTKKPIKRLISNVKPRDVSTLIKSSVNADEDPKLLASFKLLLEKIFVLDPEKRLTVSQALNHPFIKQG